ncbi:MAG TPA: hypothetical protein PLK37_11840 [Terricaulis sp.]|nr:hypothetical protein [Terricaulis sp.]
MLALAWWAAALALAFGAALGARALIDPKWAARFVRLAPDAQGGGQAEFRATYGGVMLGIHAAALLLALRYLLSGEHVVGVAAIGALAALAAGWGGAAFGRAVSIWRDGANTSFNRISIAVEAGLSLAIGAPWVLWLLG